MAKISVTLIKSGIGYSEVQKRTLKALGFHKLSQSVIHEDSPAIRGMINKVKHLIKVEEVSS